MPAPRRDLDEVTVRSGGMPRRLRIAVAIAAVLVAAVGCESQNATSTGNDPGSSVGAPVRPGTGPGVAPGVDQLPDPRRRCATTSGGRDAPRAAIVLGDGPVYAAVGMRTLPQDGGVAQLDDDIRKDGFYYHKTLWAVRRSDKGPFNVTASEVGGSRPVRFFDGQRTHRRLRLPRPDSRWGYTPSTTLIPGSGCFAFDIAGPKASYRLVFEAAVAKVKRPEKVPPG